MEKRRGKKGKRQGDEARRGSWVKGRKERRRLYNII